MTRLNPGDMVRPQPVQVVVDEPAVEKLTDAQVDEIVGKLAQLREQFPADQIEKLPKPLWKGAWDGQKGAHCNVCNGYHVLSNCLHLDYVGHANVTNRLLSVDPFWEWRPMAYTEHGTPLFTDQGMWIYLTVCGVTRLGYGDGKSVKEIIGDAIRNAAMRFGVGLDLWAKIDLHAERNVGDGNTRAETQGRGARSAAGDSSRGAVRQVRPNDSADPPRAFNQDALDALTEVCNDNGVDLRWAAQEYRKRYNVNIEVGDPEEIMEFAADLLAQADPEAGDQPTAGPEDDGGVAGGGPAVVGEHRDVEAPVPGDESGVPGPPDDPTDTSDVEPQPGDMF